MPNLELLLEQPALPGMCPITDAIHDLAHSSDAAGERGAVFTRREVADFVLDLVGYTPSGDLLNTRLLEPSFGHGDFLLPAVERLLSCFKEARSRHLPRLDHCIHGVELHDDSYRHTRSKVLELLGHSGFDPRESNRLAECWLQQSDFLLARLPHEFDFVVGNPPYVRQELIPSALLAEYRRRYATLYDRADLYVPFIERGLRLLRPGGQLGFICADRWTKNRYGGPLRSLVAREFHLKTYVDMYDTPAFHADVVAYPAIVVIERSTAGPTLVAEQPRIDHRTLNTLAKGLRGETTELPVGVRRLSDVTNGAEPWVFQASGSTDLLRRIEASFPTLEEAGCKVGIGVATGADQAYIGKLDALDVEPDRKLPLVMTRDIKTGRVDWRGYGVVNPFTDEGPLVDLKDFPRLRKHLEGHRESIAGRHVAQRDVARWYRTIDRIIPSLTWRPKLLIPDIKGDAQVVYEEGKLYPHHNLYYVISDTWNLRALQAVLLSSLSRFFVASYTTKMRGGFLRFQAQYLRRIRLPRWEEVSQILRDRLSAAAERLDIEACDVAVADLYGLTTSERAALGANSRDVTRSGELRTTSS